MGEDKQDLDWSAEDVRRCDTCGHEPECDAARYPPPDYCPPGKQWVPWSYRLLLKKEREP